MNMLVQPFGKLQLTSSESPSQFATSCSSSSLSGDDTAPSTAGSMPTSRSEHFQVCPRYPPLPRTFMNDPHIWMLGWKFDSTRFINFYYKVFPQGGVTDMDIMAVLCEIAHFRYIWLMRALLDDAPWPGPDYDHWSLPTQVIVCISFTKKGWFQRRPSAEHYGRLTKMLGNPTWFRDFLPKDQWGDHCLEAY